MSGGTTALYYAAAAVAGAVASSALAPKPQKMADPVLPERQQATKAPEQQAMRAGKASGEQGGPGVGGPASTLLTGSTGVDPSSLNLGKNTLLGG